MSSSSSSASTWIYHERQEAMLCGQHALNNLVQEAVYTPDMLAEIAHQLDAVEMNYMAQNDEGGTNSKDYLRRLQEGSGNVDAQGNFSIEVLRSALLTRYNLPLPNILQKGIGDTIEVTTMAGFICHRDSHWFAIRRINTRFWNLNSTKERPELISHFRLAAEVEALQKGGYSVFCVVEEGSLPKPCTEEGELGRGLPQYWWKEEDLLGGKGSQAMTKATDPWRNVGQGMRLDGRTPAAAGGGGGRSLGESAAAGALAAGGNIESMTEEEMLQMALAASLGQDSAPATAAAAAASSQVAAMELPPEPSPSNSQAVRIQFRMPDGTRSVRRFLKSDLVELVFVYVQEKVDGRGVQLRAGFPPVNLDEKRMDTIEVAKLGGESVQVRFV